MKNRLLALAFLILFVILAFASCGGTVKFKLNFVVDGKVYATVDTAGRESIAMPENPTKAGDEFDGWYWDKDEWNRPFTANSLLDTPLSSDLSVYAKWKSDGVNSLAQTTDESDLSVAEIISAEGFLLDGTVLSMTVPNETESYSFLGKITVSPGATWQISIDQFGIQTILTKSVPLAEGDNTFYLFVISKDETNIVTYTVSIHRRPIYNVTFNTNGGTPIAPLRIEEGGEISVPSDNPTRTHYDFAGWDNDFSNPITNNLTINANWTINDDHTWNEGLIISRATCDQNGVILFTCKGCSARKTEDIPAKGHIWGEFEVDTPPTCSAPGVKSKYCTICDMQDPDSITKIPKLAHTPGEKYVVDIEPNCSEVGFKSKHCTVCGLPIADTVVTIDPDPDAHNVEQWNVIRQATLFAKGFRTGECTYCHQPQNEEYSSIVEQKYTTEPVEKRLFVEQNIYSELLNNGEKHFYPDESNGGLGLDLYVEYSFLWNNTFVNIGNNSTSGGHAIIDTRLSSAPGDKGRINNLTWMSLKNNASGSDCTFAGGFEYGSLRTVEFGPAGMSTRTAGGPGSNYDDYPNIGGADKNNPEWGWHRVGVKFHQEVSNEAALKADTTGDVEATYYFFVETYIDGVLVSRLSNAASPDFGKSTDIKENLLFTAKSDKNGGIEYEDGDEGCYVNGMRLPFFNTTTGTAYVVYADYFATAGTGFVQSVTKVATPVANNYTTADGAMLPGAIYYTLN